ncbi:MAG: sulfur carrier protein ThiS [Gemmatimonadales bacterium]
MSGQLRVIVNGEQRRFSAPATLQTLLAELKLDPRTVVVEHDRRIVRRVDLAAAAVAEGDHVEIVHFVGGG